MPKQSHSAGLRVSDKSRRDVGRFTVSQVVGGERDTITARRPIEMRCQQPGGRRDVNDVGRIALALLGVRGLSRADAAGDQYVRTGSS